MREQIERYTRTLEGLSTLELSRSAEKLVSFERRNGAALIAHLAEISRRKGHLELGYKSLFHYCLEHLRLGEGSVWKRTQVAGVARRFPQVLEHLAQGKANLSVLAILAPHLTEENVDRLTRGGSRHRERREAHAGNPRARTRSGAGEEGPEEEARAKTEEGGGAARNSSGGGEHGEEARGNGSRGACGISIHSELCAGACSRACFSYQCEYTGPGGVRCTARARLEIDHIDSYAKGGAASEENLRALCRAHNLFSAAWEFGEDFMRGKIEGRTENHSSRSKQEEPRALQNSQL